MKTYEELEREAYINGYMRLASAYATIIDTQEQLSMIDGIDYDQLDEIDRLECEIDDLEADLEYYRERAIKAEAALEEIELQNEESQQKD